METQYLFRGRFDNFIIERIDDFPAYYLQCSRRCQNCGEDSGCNEFYFILGESNIRMCMKKYFRKINFNYRGENDDEIEEIVKKWKLISKMEVNQ